MVWLLVCRALVTFRLRYAVWGIGYGSSARMSVLRRWIWRLAGGDVDLVRLTSCAAGCTGREGRSKGSKVHRVPRALLMNSAVLSGVRSALPAQLSLQKRL